jgi:2-amino-4-hydroxy-6-hydroxymethyldihydropteridine diphosphokinase
VILRDPVTAYVALGANLGDARVAVMQAFEALACWPGIEVTGRSALARIETRLSAPDVLDALQAIEHRAGRLRPYVNAPRSLDLDLLFYGDACMHSPRLTLPHPRWRERAFVLFPLADVWPQRVGPEDLARVVGQTIERDGATHL